MRRAELFASKRKRSFVNCQRSEGPDAQIVVQFRSQAKSNWSISSLDMNHIEKPYRFPCASCQLLSRVAPCNSCHNISITSKPRKEDCMLGEALTNGGKNHDLEIDTWSFRNIKQDITQHDWLCHEDSDMASAASTPKNCTNPYEVSSSVADNANDYRKVKRRVRFLLTSEQEAREEVRTNYVGRTFLPKLRPIREPAPSFAALLVRAMRRNFPCLSQAATYNAE